jgi:hypothetical protein
MDGIEELIHVSNVTLMIVRLVIRICSALFVCQERFAILSVKARRMFMTIKEQDNVSNHVMHLTTTDQLVHSHGSELLTVELVAPTVKSVRKAQTVCQCASNALSLLEAANNMDSKMDVLRLALIRHSKMVKFAQTALHSVVSVTTQQLVLNVFSTTELLQATSFAQTIAQKVNTLTLTWHFTTEETLVFQNSELTAKHAQQI